MSASSTSGRTVQKDTDVLSGIVSALDTFTKLKKGIQEVVNTAKDLRKVYTKVSDMLDSVIKKVVADTAATDKNTAAKKGNASANKESADATDIYTAATDENSTAQDINTLASRKNASATMERTVAEEKNTVAMAANMVATQLQSVVLASQTETEMAYIAAKELSLIATGGMTKALVANTIAAGASTVAMKILNAAMMAMPFIAAAAGLAVLVSGIVSLVNHMSKGSEAYQAQKKEVEELADAQEELTKSFQDSADAFADSAAHLEASGKVAQNLVGEMKAVSASTEDAAAKHQKMAALCVQLNSAMDGLNLTYDEENDCIRNINSGQEISLEQLDKLVAAKAKLAKTDAWAARQNELLAEQVRIEEELAILQQKRDAIMADQSLSTSDRNDLLKDLMEMEDNYTTQMEENEARLLIVNQNIADSTDQTMGIVKDRYGNVMVETADQVVSSYERIDSAVTSSGESLQQVADQWGVSTEDILAAMEAQGITLDEWVANQESAWEDYQAAVSEKTAAVVNSFQKIPDQFDMSGQQMLDNLMSNKEQYAAWEASMAEITRLLGPTAAEEFRKLGPEANSALEEILNTEGMLEQYAERKNGNGGGAKQAAERKKNALSMCGEVSSRHNTQGKKVDLVGGEKKGGVQQRWTKESFALGVLIY